MALQDLANVGEILGAAGVIASLVFVGWQIRANTKAARLRMHEQVTQNYMSFLSSILVDPGSFAAGFKSEQPDFADLNDAQKTFFFATMLGFFKHFEVMYVQYSQGVMDKETWSAWSTHIRMEFPGNLTRPESACPMRFFQLTSETRLAVADRSECQEAILKVARQKRAVLQVSDRLSLGVQHALYSLDDLFAMSQEQSQKLDMRLKRRPAKTFACHNSSPP